MSGAAATIWGVHHSGGLAFVEQRSVAIGWPAAGDLSELPDDRDDFKARLRSAYPDRGEPWIANAAGQLLRFRHVMQPGDLVVYPRKLDRTINLGLIAADYVYDPGRSERYPNTPSSAARCSRRSATRRRSRRRAPTKASTSSPARIRSASSRRC